MSFMYLAVEDELSEVVGTKIIKQTLGLEISIQVLRNKGSGYLKSRLSNFADMSRRYPVLLITDLDAGRCAPSLKAQWFKGIDQPDNFLFRVAVREVEAWLLADVQQFSRFLGVSQALLPPNPEHLDDPKRVLINIAKKAKRDIRLDIVRDQNGDAKQGLGYNRVLGSFVENEWSIQDAAQNSDSLRRTCQRVAELAN